MKVKLNGIEYNLIENYMDCFDHSELESKINDTDYFNDFDYILGDYAYGKLRLKGFYRSDNKNVKDYNNYSKIKEYISEYCSYGCHYFILEKEPKTKIKQAKTLEIYGIYGKMILDNKGDEKMDNKKVLSIIKEDGTKEEVELIISFVFNDTKKEYVVYTRNEKDDNGNTTLYVSSVDRSGNMPKMGGVETDEEWSRIKDVLRELAKNDQKGELA